MNIEEFFPDYRMEADASYFVQACRDLTEQQKDEVRRQFAEMLTNEGICKKRNMPSKHLYIYIPYGSLVISWLSMNILIHYMYNLKP